MMIDISKWIVIILIFFIAFACSLFLIFSYFAVTLQQKQILMATSNNTASRINSLMRSSNLMAESHSQFEAYYSLLNQSIPNITQSEMPVSNHEDEQGFCEQTKNYDKIKQIGPHPAIYYFGEGFGSTILTIFFTLFGVIAEDELPVSMKVYSGYLIFFLLRRIEDMNLLH